MARIFISYSRADLANVQELVRDLQDSGHTCWFDQEINGGQKWWDNVLAQIRNCDIFIVGLSQNCLDSQACKRELEYARNLGKLILPVQLAEELHPNFFPAALSELQYIDYSRGDKRAALALGRAISELPEPSPLPEPLPAPPPAPLSYLVTFMEKIASEEPLDYKEQLSLVIELRDHYRQGRPPGEILQMLDRLGKRDDLLAKIALEIDAVGKEIRQGSPGAGNQGAATGRESIKAPPKEKPPEKKPQRETPGRKPDVADGDKPQHASSGAHLSMQDFGNELERLMRRACRYHESWSLKIDDKNVFTISHDPEATPPCLLVRAHIVDTVGGGRAKLLKTLGWKVNADTLGKGFLSGAALYATGGLAAFALLSKGVRQELMGFESEHSWPMEEPDSNIASAISECVVALERVAPDAKQFAIKKEKINC